MELNVLTLNCWGLPFGESKDKKERMEHIAKELASGSYHIVSLQEIWALEDYELIKGAVEKVMPYSFYFRMGLLYGGLCMFSKWPIIDTLYHTYSLNGYAHKIREADWYISKMVALVKIDMEGITVNVYNTHAHALYAPSNIPEKDDFLTHRVTQLYEMSEFVRMTSESADLVLVTGDFNSEPFSLATKLALSNARLSDAWEMRENKENLIGQTCEWSGNPYTALQTRYYVSDGERIDYITYRTSPSLGVTCTECRCLKNPTDRLAFSDHEAVKTTLVLNRRRDSQGEGDAQIKCANTEDGSSWQQLPEHLKESIALISDNITKLKSEQRWMYVRAIFCLFLLLLSPYFASVTWVLALVWTCGVTLLMAFFFCMGVIVKECEHKTLTGFVEGMKIRLCIVEKQATEFKKAQNKSI